MVPGSRNAGLTFSRPPVEPGFGDSQAVERETLGKTSFSGFSLRLHAAAEQQIPVKKEVFSGSGRCGRLSGIPCQSSPLSSWSFC